MMNLLTQRLPIWRMARGLSQRELAERAGIPRPNLIDLELGRRDCTIGTLIKLAEALGVTPGRLLDGEPRKTTKRLNRFDRDALARAILRGSIPESSKLRRMAVDLRPLFAPLLEAAGLKAPLQDRHFVRRRKYRLESVYSREFLNDIADRIRRLLPSFVKEGSL